MRIRAWLAGVAFALAAACNPVPPEPEDIPNICDTPDGQVAVNLKTDVNHCGACNRVCTAVYAAPICDQGTCSHGPCETGWVDLDPAEPGCEAVADDESVPGSGVVFWALTSGGAYGDAALSSTSYVTHAALGESTPVPTGGAVRLESAHYRNLTGFNAILH